MQIEYEPLPPVFTIEESERQEIDRLGRGQSAQKLPAGKGRRGFRVGRARRTLSRASTAPARRNISTLRTRASSRSTARKAASRCGARCSAPTTCFKSLRAVFDLPEDKVRVIQTETGGAFGGKEDYPSTLACHAALLAMKSGHPVKMVYDRMEDLAATTKRHPSRVRHRTALDRDGKLLAMEIDLATDGGAYATLSSTVLSRATLHSTGPVSLPQCARAMRAPGRPITFPTAHFAASARRRRSSPWSGTWMRSPRRIGIDPVELRRRNFLHDGDTNATEQVMREPVILDQLLDRALRRERLPRQARAVCPRESERAQSSAAWASPLSITARDSPARARCI